MHTRKLSAGDIIDARCTRCKAVLNHRIVAMVGDRVVRVECNTCNGMHNYYPPPDAKPNRTSGSGSATSPSKAASAAPRAPRRDPGQAEREEWAALRPNMSTETALPYSMEGRYKADNLIKHPVFGIGVVRQIIPPNKMQVLFEDGVKLLRCR